MKLNEVKDFVCDWDSCDRSYDTVGKLNAYIKLAYNWQPYVYNNKGDYDGTYIFQTKNEFHKHGKYFHSPYTPSKCQYPSCTSKVTFKTTSTYRSHLTTFSLSDTKERDKYMPGKKSAFVY
jgi:hypothetical protein